jgi:xylan 1,4-beta-xylosidase
MVWHYHDDDVAGPEAKVELELNNLPLVAGTAKITCYQIDQTHSNAYAEWQRLGSPGAPNETQYAQMKKAGQLATVVEAPASVLVQGGATTVTLVLARQAVALLVLEWQ